MKIQLIKITINNFKGISSLEIRFNPDITNLRGTNATGKSTIYDAFWWCLFGKDSSGSAQFTIKPQDENGKPLSKLDNEVEVVLSADGRHVKLKRVQREKWVTRRGESEATFTGHEVNYFVDEVRVAMKEFNAAVADLVSEDVFKTITSITHFNGLKWQERREILFSLVGSVSDSDVATKNPEFQKLLDKIQGKDLERFKTEIRQKIKRAKEALEHIPARIDEVNRSIPEAVNVEAVNKAIEAAERKIEEINDQLASGVKANEQALNAARAVYAELSDAKAELDTYIRQIRAGKKVEAERKAEDLNRAKREYDNAVERANSTRSRIEFMEAEQAELAANMEERRKSWQVVNAETFTISDEATACPACKQPFPEDKIQETRNKALAEFNQSKMTRLSTITEAGKRVKLKHDALTKDIEKLREELKNQRYIADQAKQAWEKMKQAAEPSPEMHPEFNPEQQAYIDACTEKIQALQDKYSEQKAALEKPDDEQTAALRTKRAVLQAEIKELNKNLQTEQAIEAAKSRIEDLEKEQRTLSQQIAELQRLEFTIEEFTKAKIDLIEEKLNAMFSFVQFRMFEPQINEGIRETCVTLVDGVPYPDLNTASKVNAGLDIINVLSKKYEVQAPVFIDNRESVVSLIDSDTQLINLIVDESKPVLEVS